MNNLKEKLDRVLNPRVVAVVGDKQQSDYMWLRSMSTFAGKVYSVQVDPKELPGIAALGVENYPSLLDVPGDIDYVVVAVPRAVAPRIVHDCIQKGVGGATLFTSGFAETSTEEGIKLQEIITEMAKAADFPLIGPNCMGVFNPRLGLRHSVDQYHGEKGPVAFISQSGTHATFFSQVGWHHAIKVSKSVSYGNAVVLDSPDYLEYLGQDEETRLIAMYTEGVKNGRRFFEVLREVARRKPVVIWKGGQTEAGTRATSSHTASLAIPHAVWQGMVRQCRAVPVDTFDELIDTVKGLLYIKPPAGTGVGLIATTGGQSVVITDAFVKAGLSVPLLTEASYEQLGSFFTIIGGSYRNPLDISSNFSSVGNLVRMLDILGSDLRVDSVVLELSVGFLHRRWQRNPQFREEVLEALTAFMARSQKPFLAILNPGHMEAAALEVRHELQERGIANFPAFHRGAAALRHVVDYYQCHGHQGPVGGG